MADLLPRADLELLAGDDFQEFVGRDGALATKIAFAVGQAGDGTHGALDLGTAAHAAATKPQEFAADAGTLDELREPAWALAIKLGG
jgi:hypothetical protein